MRIKVVAGAALIALAACDGAKPGDQAGPAGDEIGALESALPTPGSCKDIEALAAAFKEPEPFASLRTGAAVNGRFATAVSPANAKCDIGTRPGLGPTPPTLHVVNCQLFSSGAANRAEDAVRAKAVFDAARADLKRCLPEEWTMRNGASAEIDVTEAMIYETRADAQRSMTASFYSYPVELKKEWVEAGPAGETAGWRVRLTFQAEAGGAPPAPAPTPQ